MKRVCCCLVFTALFVRLGADAPVRYRVSVPEPQHRWLQVEATFPAAGNDPVELRMSRSSPGRYSLHDFAKNVFDVHAFGADGRELPPGRPDPSGWSVSGHGGSVTVRYKVYGDRVDGTYLAVDSTHAHINMPAAMMWARGFDDRSVSLVLEPPAGAAWQPATQLFPGSTPLEFTAPNFQYFMDSPVEFGQIALREFAVDGSRFRFALHHTGTDAELDAFSKDVEKVVREQRAIYGEYPPYEPGYYTFLADYLPWADGDGMEHRNSTVISEPGSIARDGRHLLGTVAHEFFHCWNVERIRPRGLEPFDFDRGNLSGELWLAEGFTQYYGPLSLQRAGLADLASTARTLTGLVETVAHSEGRLVRSAEEMSEMAPFIDGGHPVDRTNWSRTVISYYPFGGAIALALDLTLRDRTAGRSSLDDFMRAMWHRFGKPGGARPGYVDRPYTRADAEATLAEVSGDPAFARDFFARYIVGREIADYARLLSRAGFLVRPRNPGAAWLGDLSLEPVAAGRPAGGRVRLTGLVARSWPIYTTGIEQDDEILSIGGVKVASTAEVAGALARFKPGDRVAIAFLERGGARKTADVTLAENPHIEVVPVEQGLTPAQKALRDGWLKSRG